jgi:secondary thiamine-phosphate synthase enzyme
LAGIPSFSVIAIIVGYYGRHRTKVRCARRVESREHIIGVPFMKTLTEYLKFHTKTHRAYVHITPQVEEIVSRSGVNEGMALVSAMHITAGVYVNDNESGLIEDIDQWLEHLAPFHKNYKHHETGEDNGDSHLKALLIHHEVIVPITAGKLDLGRWQRIFYAEFDGQRDKRVIVKVMGE